MDLGIEWWITKRTSGLSIPIPKATVATITWMLLEDQLWCTELLDLASSWAWYALALTPRFLSSLAISSESLIEKQYIMPARAFIINTQLFKYGKYYISVILCNVKCSENGRMIFKIL